MLTVKTTEMPVTWSRVSVSISYFRKHDAERMTQSIKKAYWATMNLSLVPHVKKQSPVTHAYNSNIEKTETGSRAGWNNS